MSSLGFSEENVVVLPMAFDTKQIEIKGTSNFFDPIQKKTPKKEFSDACQNLCSKIFSKIKENLNNRDRQPTMLETIMDNMEHIWELLDKYPDLLRYLNPED